MTKWQLKPGSDRRLRQGHPWIFSNELMQSPKGHTPGESVEIYDSLGQYLASGYGNPHSLIAFRALSYRSQDENVCDPYFVCRQLTQSWKQRFSLGLKTSFRLCFGEGDFLPGLVVDRYVVKQGEERFQVFAFQLLTAGMQKILSTAEGIENFFSQLVDESIKQGFSDIDFSHTIMVKRNDVNIRKLEGLEYEQPEVFHNVSDLDLKNAVILLSPWFDAEFEMICDLQEGQKTGFFLDQSYNIQAVGLMLNQIQWPAGKLVRILDLCCYVGQWSSHLAEVLKKRGYLVDVTLVDTSAEALSYATRNVKKRTEIVTAMELDVMKDLDSAVNNNDFDIVICDPPAFIKAKKDLPTGQAAYAKLNSIAFKKAKSGGLVVSCSCSGLLTDEDFRFSIKKGLLKSGKVGRAILHGGHAPDHPLLLSYDEGLYLKMYGHQIL